MSTTVRTARLVLTSLVASDAVEMSSVLSDVGLYEFTGGEPPTLAQLTAQYRAQVAGPSTPDEKWCNWIVRLAETNEAIGYVQATVTGDSADIAWVIGSAWQHRGFAREAGAAMCKWLQSNGAEVITAHIHPGHLRSAQVAVALGLQVSDDVDSDGEQVWTTARIAH